MGHGIRGVRKKAFRPFCLDRALHRGPPPGSTAVRFFARTARFFLVWTAGPPRAGRFRVFPKATLLRALTDIGRSGLVRWSGPANPGFARLMEWAWQVRDGVLYLPAVHDAKDAAMIQNRVAMHNGIMRTFLQHTNVQPKGELVTRIIRLDENREVSVTYQPPIIRPPKAKEEGNAPRKNALKKLLKKK